MLPILLEPKRIKKCQDEHIMLRFCIIIICLKAIQDGWLFEFYAVPAAKAIYYSDYFAKCPSKF